MEWDFNIIYRWTCLATCRLEWCNTRLHISPVILILSTTRWWWEVVGIVVLADVIGLVGLVAAARQCERENKRKKGIGKFDRGPGRHNTAAEDHQMSGGLLNITIQYGLRYLPDSNYPMLAGLVVELSNWRKRGKQSWRTFVPTDYTRVEWLIINVTRFMYSILHDVYVQFRFS